MTEDTGVRPDATATDASSTSTAEGEGNAVVAGTDPPPETPDDTASSKRARSDRTAARRARRELAVALRAERRRIAPDDQRRARSAALAHRPGVLGSAAGGPDPDAATGLLRELAVQLVGLVRALHPRTTLLGGVAVGVLALVSGRPPREAVVAGAGVLVALAVLGLVNDVRDQDLDHANAVPRKPVAEGRVPAGNAGFVAACLAVLLVPLSLQNGVLAATALLGIVLLGLLSTLWLRRTWLSWATWAGSFALVPAYLSYGGWGIAVQGAPPTLSVTVLAALLGVAVHFLLSLPDLVADRRSGFRHLPLRIALHTGATALLVVTLVFGAAVLVGLVASGVSAGLTQ